jgi:uncharacterized protein (TIGR03085 family)
MTIAEDIRNERQRFVALLDELGPDAPTLCEPWTAGDLAAHVLSIDRMAGVPTFEGRLVVQRFGWRLNEMWRRPRAANALMWATKRHEFEWIVDRLRKDPPRLLLRPSVGVVGLFEIWGHREDLRRPNDRPSPGEPDLAPVVPWLFRYQRRFLSDTSLRVVADDGREWTAGTGPEAVIRGPLSEVVLWLGGRAGVARVELDGEPDAVARLDGRLYV